MKRLRPFIIILLIFLTKIGFTQNLAHEKDINEIKFSQDNSLIITSGDDKTVRVWDTRSGKMLHALKHNFQIKHVLISPDNKYLITSVNDSTYHCVWNLDLKKNLKCLINQKVKGFSPDSKEIVVLDKQLTEGKEEGKLILISVKDFSRRAFENTFPLKDSTENILIHQKTNKIFIKGDKLLWIFSFDNLASIEKKKINSLNEGQEILLSPSLKYFILEGSPVVYDYRKSKALDEIDSNIVTEGKLFFKDEKNLISIFQQKIFNIDLASPKIEKLFDLPENELYALSSDGKWICLTQGKGELLIYKTSEDSVYRSCVATDILKRNDFNNYLRGSVYFKLKKYKKAVEYFSLAENKSETSNKLYLMRGEAYCSLKKYDLALKDFYKDNEMFPARAFLNIARAYAGKREIDSTIKYLDTNQRTLFCEPIELIIKDPSFKVFKDNDKWISFIKSLNGNQRQTQLLSIVDGREQKGDLLGALEYLNKLLEEDKNNIHLLNKRGLIYLKLNQFDEAIEDFKKVGELNPNHELESYKNIAKAIQGKGETENTILLLEDCMNTDASNFDLLLVIAELEVARYRRKDALEAVSRYIEVIPDDSYAYYLKATIVSNPSEAKDNIEKAIETCKNNGEPIPNEYSSLLKSFQ